MALCADASGVSWRVAECGFEGGVCRLLHKGAVLGGQVFGCVGAVVHGGFEFGAEPFHHRSEGGVGLCVECGAQAREGGFGVCCCLLHPQHDAGAVAVEVGECAAQFGRAQGKEVVEAFACQRVAVELQGLPDVPLCLVEVAGAVDDGVPRRADEVRKRQFLQGRCGVPWFGVHGARPCERAAHHANHREVGGHGAHVWKAVFPAQILARGECRVASQQSFDEVCA